MVSLLLDAGGWFPTHRALIKKIGIEAAVVLQYLINYKSRVGDSDGWFYCTIEKMKDELGISTRTQRRLIGNLIEENLIESKQMGGPPARRHFKLNTKAISEVVLKWGQSRSCKNEGDTSCESAHSRSCENALPQYSNKKNSKKITSKKKKVGAAKNGDTHVSPSLLDSQDEEFDEQQGVALKEILTTNGSELVDVLPPRKEVSTKRLAKNFLRLRMDRSVPREDIQEFMEWYAENYEDEFVPKIHKPLDLSDRWPKYINAMKRMKKVINGNGSSTREAADRLRGKWDG
jgi:hypothetical protein